MEVVRLVVSMPVGRDADRDNPDDEPPLRLRSIGDVGDVTRTLLGGIDNGCVVLRGGAEPDLLDALNTDREAA